MRISDWSSDVCSSDLLTRSNRKGFSIFFDIDESRINNYTNIRAVSSYQIVKIATVLSYGRNVEEALVEGHKQRISFLWYAISRSWSAVRADGFTGFTTYSLYHLRLSGHMLKTQIGRAHVCTPVTNAHL